MTDPIEDPASEDEAEQDSRRQQDIGASYGEHKRRLRQAAQLGHLYPDTKED